MRLSPPLTAVLLVTALSGCGGGGGSSSFDQPFTSDGGIEAGPSSGLWGDDSAGQQGNSIGCIRGRHFAVLITVHNKTAETIELLGAADRQKLGDVIERVAVQVSLAPPPSNGPFAVVGLKSWDSHDSPSVLIPPGRDAWVQSNYAMHNCAQLREAVTVNRSTTLAYRTDGGRHTQTVSVPAARIILTEGPAHPSLPVNQVG
jgi:hypothetical protein